VEMFHCAATFREAAHITRRALHRPILTCITEKLKYHTYMPLHSFTLTCIFVCSHPGSSRDT